MPPRGAPARGGPRGVGGARGGRGGPTRGGPQVGSTTSGSHITTIGVKRPDYGTSGRTVPIFVNSFVTTIPEGIIHHYDGAIPLESVFNLL